MKRIIVLAALVSVVSSCAFIKIDGKSLKNLIEEEGGSSSQWITPSGNVETRTYDFDGITAIELASTFDVIYSQGEPSMTVTASDNVLDALCFELEDGVLKNKANLKFKGHDKVTIRISTETIERFSFSGAVDFIAKGPIKAADLSVTVNGAGDLDFQELIADNVTMNISGAGDVDIKHLEADTLNVAVNGAGDLDVAGRCDTAVLRVNGAGDIDVHNLDVVNLDTKVNGVGSINKK